MNHLPPSARKLVRLLLGVGLVSLSLAGVAAVQLARAGVVDFHGTRYPDTPLAPAFTLTDHTGSRLSLENLRGRPVLLFFGFTECPDVCPLALAKLQRILDEEGVAPDEISVLLVTVDPENDTPERLAEYVRSIGPSVTGLTGTREEIESVLGLYGAYAQPSMNHDGHPVIAHTYLVFGIDRTGHLQVLIHADEPDEVVRDDIRALMRIGA